MKSRNFIIAITILQWFGRIIVVNGLSARITPNPNKGVGSNIPNWWKDAQSVVSHLGICVTISVGICTFQDAYVWYNEGQPAQSLLGSATRGMGQHADSNEEVPTYNDILYQHRSQRVVRWKKQSVDTVPKSTREDVETVGRTLKSIVETAKPMANDYAWDDLHELLKSSEYTSDLYVALDSIHQNLARTGKEEVIGYDWGSCAWRRNACGGLADYQEARAELYNLVGLLEPFECQFILDIMERSLRDILTTTSTSTDQISKWIQQNPYKAYESVNYDGTVDPTTGESSTLDQEYLSVLQIIRIPSFDKD